MKKKVNKKQTGTHKSKRGEEIQVSNRDREGKASMNFIFLKNYCVCYTKIDWNSIIKNILKTDPRNNYSLK